MLQKREHAILYDGRCTLCTTSKRFVETLDWLQRFEWINFFDSAHMPNITCISAEELDDGMAVIDSNGHIHRGFVAWRFILARTPLTFASALPLYLLPIKWLGSWLYGFIARNRKIWFKPLEACDVPTETKVQLSDLACFKGIEKANGFAKAKA
jgi:predicted DCC family thiol-disulfide oxidoreductase YuxK